MTEEVVRGRTWPLRLRRALTWLFFGAVATFIVLRLGAVDWAEVAVSLRAYDAATLAGAAGLTLTGHAAAACYDLLARHYVGHTLPAPRTFAINFIAYAFSLNLGALIGGWGFRVRLYARHALRGGDIARIIVLAVVTNWSGFVLLTGAMLVLAPPQLPPPWPAGIVGTRLVGAVLLAAVAAYLWLCLTGPRRGWRLRVRGVELPVPTLRMAALQLLLSVTSWLMIVLTMLWLMPPELTFARLLAVVFVASMVGAATHVPGSVGVLEGTVLLLLGDELGDARVLAAVLAFRAVYYLMPFAVAAAGYAALEAGARRRG